MTAADLKAGKWIVMGFGLETDYGQVARNGQVRWLMAGITESSDEVTASSSFKDAAVFDTVQGAQIEHAARVSDHS